MTKKKYQYILCFFLCLFLVSCSTTSQSDYIENTLLEANNYISNDNVDKALESYKNILQKDPLNQKTLFNQAILLQYQKKYDSALENIDKIIDNYPFNIKAYQLKIDILKEQNLNSLVIEIYQNLLDEYPHLYSLRVDYINFLLSYESEISQESKEMIKENSIFLLENNEEVKAALKALCTVEKNNAEYSALLYLYDKSTWLSIYSQENGN
ncbi:MAG: tetratricopeptide repeat protein [Sphaerochaetaceae bacterium]|nr:tetratricopeptide repeat protein [Sphaerochaetaceae bacterium]